MSEYFPQRTRVLNQCNSSNTYWEPITYIQVAGGCGEAYIGFKWDQTLRLEGKALMVDFRNWKRHFWEQGKFSRDSCNYTMEFFYSPGIFWALVTSCTRGWRGRMKRLSSSLAVFHSPLSKVLKTIQCGKCYAKCKNRVPWEHREGSADSPWGGQGRLPGGGNIWLVSGGWMSVNKGEETKEKDTAGTCSTCSIRHTK